MSGGSWSYLYCKEIDDLLQYEGLIEDMADRLASLGYANDAAKETQELVLVIRQFRNHAGTIKDRLSDIWRAIEWWDSSDSGEDGVKNALKEYRGDNAEQGAEPDKKGAPRS